MFSQRGSHISRQPWLPTTRIICIKYVIDISITEYAFVFVKLCMLTNRPLGYGWSNMQVITFDTTTKHLNSRLLTTFKLCCYKPITWLFGRLVIKWPLTLGRFVEFPQASPSGILQTSLGLRGYLMTNFPQAMLLEN